MLHLERTVVSRKTANDGRLEIQPATAKRIRAAGFDLRVVVGDVDGPATVETMPCGCAKGAAGHEHVFLKSAPLRTLSPESVVQLALDTTPNPPTVYVTAG